jgi:F-type H+-transporting ATPase subunit alpha
MPFERQAVAIYASVNGYLAKVPVAQVPEFEEKFLTFLDAERPEVLTSIAKARDIAAQTEAELKAELDKFTKLHGWS